MPCPQATAPWPGCWFGLYLATGEPRYLRQAEAQIVAFSGELSRNFFPLATLLNNAELLQAPLQAVIVGDRSAADAQALAQAVFACSLPNRVLTFVDPSDALPSEHPAAGKGQVDGRATAYICLGPGVSGSCHQRTGPARIPEAAMGRLTVDSPVGTLTITAASGALTRIVWVDARADDDEPVLRDAAQQLAAYFTGALRSFTLPLSPRGEPFQQRVWQAMLEIPWGSVASYGEISRKAGGNPRAVGTACGANPIPIVIPCHRVVGTGHMGGYSGAGGLETKHHLLALEGALLL